jgi:prepilin-type N-terminal cleavage/methylation domain-containing protein
MLNRIKKSNKDGFTIIEVMIVLAIAGLILLIVFLAVPALQRSSRNTQRKNDAAAVGASIANYIANNGGTVPTEIGSTATNTLTVGSAATPNTETATLGFYSVLATQLLRAGADGNVNIVTTATPGTPTNPTQDLVIDYGYQCNGTNTGIGNASPRTAAILYWTETGSGSTAYAEQCVEQ